MTNDDDMEQIFWDREDTSGIRYSPDVTLVDEYGGMATIGLSQVDGPCHTVQQYVMEVKKRDAWMESGIGSSSRSLGLDDLFDDDSSDDPKRRLSDGASSGLTERDRVSVFDDDDDDVGDKNSINNDEDGGVDFLRHDEGRSLEQLARDARMYVWKFADLCANV